MNAAIDLYRTVQDLDESRPGRIQQAAEEIAEGLLAGDVYEAGEGILRTDFGLDDVLAAYMEPGNGREPTDFELALAALLTARNESDKAEAATLYTHGLRSTALRFGLQIAELRIN